MIKVVVDAEDFVQGGLGRSGMGELLLGEMVFAKLIAQLVLGGFDRA